jgi:hypothetical protein
VLTAFFRKQVFEKDAVCRGLVVSPCAEKWLFAQLELFGSTIRTPVQWMELFTLIGLTEDASSRISAFGNLRGWLLLETGPPGCRPQVPEVKKPFRFIDPI